MKIKPILCSVAAASMMAAFTSCQSEEGVKNPVETGVDLSNCETVSLSISMPTSEMKTRAGETPTFSYGDDGLFSFDRTIDRLWYAVYNNGNLLYHSVQPGITQAVYDAEKDAFTLDIQIPKINDEIKLEEYSVFFFAGNALDKVDTKEINNGIGLDFANKTMYAYPALMNRTVASGEMFNPQQYDYFAKYITLDKVVSSGYNGSVTLIRPFCQVSLLTDELCQASVLGTYASDGKVAVKTTPSMFTQRAMTTANTLPYGWNYETDNILVKGIADLSFTLDARAFNNVDNSYTIPQEVTFKERKMFCVASYLMLAPSAKKAYDAESDKEQFSFALNVSGDRGSTDASASADVPTGGLKANEKYIMYNKKYDPSTGEGGGGGILSSHYLVDIVVDPTWEGNNEIGF